MKNILNFTPLNRSPNSPYREVQDEGLKSRYYKKEEALVIFDEGCLSSDDSLSNSSNDNAQSSALVSKSSQAIQVQIKSFSKSPDPSPLVDNRLYQNRLAKLHFVDRTSPKKASREVSFEDTESLKSLKLHAQYKTNQPKVVKDKKILS